MRYYLVVFLLDYNLGGYHYKMSNILEANNINYTINRIDILSNVSLQIPKSKFVALLGKNGSGKSTLISCILGLITNYKGNIKINDIDARNAQSRKYIAYIPSEFYKLNNTTIKKFLFTQAYLLGLNKNEATIRIKQICNDIGYPYERIKLRFNVLSSGLKKVIAIIQALLNPNLKLIIADEPLVNLDSETRNIFLKILKKMVDEQEVSIFFATHEVSEITQYVDQTIKFVNGKITEVQNLH
jgi:ABC-type multidrug transport system ATPase subunit